MFARHQWTKAERGELTALIKTSEALLISDQTFDALIEELRAGIRFKQAIRVNRDPRLRAEVITVLQQVMYWVKERNTLKGHNETVWGISFSPDGQRIATASWDHTAKIWSVDGRLLKTLEGHRDRIYGLSFSPNGQRVATASYDRTMKLWTVEGDLLQTFEGHWKGLMDVSFSPDGTLLATASQDGTVKLWNPSGELQQPLTDPADEVRSVSFSPDSQTLAAASRDNSVRLWSRSGTLLKTVWLVNGSISWLGAIRTPATAISCITTQSTLYIMPCPLKKPIV